MEKKRRSTASSCESCRLRKVKCSKPEFDACQRCRRLGKECLYTSEKKARPYYQPSKERYELMVKVIHHFVPSADMDTESLRQLLKVLADEKSNRLDRQEQSETLDSVVDAAAIQWSPSENMPNNSVSLATDVIIASASSNALEVNDGAFLGDAMNTARYQSGSSCASFHNLTRAFLLSSTNYSFRCLQEIVRPQLCMLDGQMIQAPSLNDLPPRPDLEKAATRFFAEVNSVVYVMSEDLFRYRVDDLYCNHRSCSNSVLAIINLVLAVGNQSETAFKVGCSYFEKSLEEATEESIIVVMLTVLYRQNNDQRNLAWIQLSAGIRIAQSLGWHVADKFQKDQSPYKIQNRKKLWSSLYELDQFLSCSLGRPSAVVGREGMLVQDAEPHATYPSSLGYCAAVASFGRILGRICSHIYLQTQHSMVDESMISSLIDEVQSWWHSLPSYLRSSGSAEPSYFRSICYIGLRYNYALMLITRRHLLQALISRGRCSEQVLSRVRVCEEAHDRSTIILRDMASKDVISQLIWFDSLFLFCNVNLTAVRCFQRNKPSRAHASQVCEFVPILETVLRNSQGRWKKWALDYVIGFSKALQQDLDHIDAQSETYLIDLDSQSVAEMLGFADDNMTSFFLSDLQNAFWNG